MIGLRQLDRVIGLVSTAILARLLLPDDFGLVVYGLTFFAIVDLFFQFGFETVLIRDQDAGADSYDTAWTLEIIKGFVLCALLIAGAIPISQFFNEPRVEAVLYFLAAVPILNGFKNIGVVDFRKKMEFDKEFKFKFSVRVVSVIATILLALHLRSYWALVYGMLISGALALVLSYIMSPFRPKFGLSQFSRIFGFSKWLLVQNIMLGLNERLPILVLGRFYESRVVAFYSMGFDISNMTSGEFAAPIRRALFPGVASIADNERQIVAIVLSAIGIIGFVGLPVTIGVAVTAPILVPLLLGGNWNEIIPIIQILAINGVALALYSNSFIVFYAVDRPNLAALASGLRMVILAPAVLFLVPDYGAAGAAWALSGTNVVVTLAEYVIFCSIVNIRVGEIVSVVWRSIVAVSVMGVVTIYCMSVVDSSGAQLPQFLQLMLVAGVGAFSYVTVVLVLWLISGKPDDGAEAYALKMLRKIRRKEEEAPG